MKPRRVLLSLEIETDVSLAYLTRMREVRIGAVMVEVLQSSANVIRQRALGSFIKPKKRKR